jgi:hypothetical protein
MLPPVRGVMQFPFQLRITRQKLPSGRNWIRVPEGTGKPLRDWCGAHEMTLQARYLFEQQFFMAEGNMIEDDQVLG